MARVRESGRATSDERAHVDRSSSNRAFSELQILQSDPRGACVVQALTSVDGDREWFVFLDTAHPLEDIP